MNDTGIPESDDVLNAYIAAQNTGLDPDRVDVPLPDIIDDIESTTGPFNVDELDELDLLEAVMSRGSVMFGEGRMMVKCPAYDGPAICGMFPLPHPATQDLLMVCCGPSIAKDSRFSILDWERKEFYETKRVISDCPFHPERINKPPTYLPKMRKSEPKGWL